MKYKILRWLRDKKFKKAVKQVNSMTNQQKELFKTLGGNKKNVGTKHSD